MRIKTSHYIEEILRPTMPFVGQAEGKGRLRTLSSTVESRKFMSRRDRNGASTLGVLYPVGI